MTKRIILYLFLVTYLSCKQEKTELNSLLGIIDYIKENESLESNPNLVLDGFDVLYEKFPENSEIFEENKIGYFKYINAEESRKIYKEEYKNGVVIMTSKLWLPKENEKKKVVYYVNGKEMQFDNYKKLELESIVKKGVIEGKEDIEKLFSLDGDILIFIKTKNNASS